MLEAAITVPIIFVLLMFIVQWAIMWHASSVAQAAAQEGLRTAESYNATASAGHQDAVTFLGETAPHLLPNATVQVDRSPTEVTVRIDGPVMTVIPFAHFAVHESASGPVEKFTAAR